ncbi:MAG: hypothetical protein ACXABG_14185 [Promethearchaeota archaeon]|jgi:hypothetical protein
MEANEVNQEEIIDTIRIRRGRLAILRDVIQPYNDEKCYIKVAPRYLRFSVLTSIIAFEYKILRMKEMDLTGLGRNRRGECNFLCKVGDLSIILSPFTKSSFSKPLKSLSKSPKPETVRKASDIVTFELMKDKCRFRQGAKFIGEQIAIEETEDDLWFDLPSADDGATLNGDDFRDAVNIFSATGEGSVLLSIEDELVFIKSQAGKRLIGSKPANMGEKSMKLPKSQLEKACNVVGNFINFKVEISEKYIVLLGRAEDSTLKIHIFKLS